MHSQKNQKQNVTNKTVFFLSDSKRDVCFPHNNYFLLNREAILRCKAPHLAIVNIMPGEERAIIFKTDDIKSYLVYFVQEGRPEKWSKIQVDQYCDRFGDLSKRNKKLCLVDPL